MPTDLVFGLIACFPLDSIWKSAFFKPILPSFQGTKFNFKSDLYVFSPWNSTEKLLAGEYEQICCDSLHFQDMRGPKYLLILY